MVRKVFLWIQALVFLMFIAVFFEMGLFSEDRGFSEMENRALQTRPSFSFSRLFSGQFAEDYEEYISDQFPFRDAWITLKARSELAQGKEQNKGIFLCEGDTLIDAFEAPDVSELEKRVSYVNTLTENTTAEVLLALIPSAAEVWDDRLPDGAPNDSQKEIIEKVYGEVTADTVDLLTPLKLHSGEPLYYRTDHHWTTLGAYYAYAALMEAQGEIPTPLSDFTPETVTESFYGSNYSSSGFSWVAPDSIETYVTQGGVEITNYPYGEPTEGSLYVESFLSVKDKYSYFYGGNTPQLEIETGNGGPSLLILRDSYMDSLSPFLFSHYGHISILDLRYYKASLKEYIEEQGFDRILVCYSVNNFCTDGNLFLLSSSF